MDTSLLTSSVHYHHAEQLDRDTRHQPVSSTSPSRYTCDMSWHVMLQHVTRDLGGHNFMLVSDEDTLDIATVSSQLCLEHQVQHYI